MAYSMVYHNDNLIYMLGAVTLVIVMLGAAFTEGDAYDARRPFHVNFGDHAEVTDNYASQSGYNDEDDPADEIEFDIGETLENDPEKHDAFNLVMIRFMLTWEDGDYIEADEDTGDKFTLEIYPPVGFQQGVDYERAKPQNMRATQRAFNGEIIITIFVQDIPKDMAGDTAVVAESENDAREKVTSEKSRGVWTALVNCEEAGGSTGLIGYETDEGEDYLLQVSISQYVIESVFDPSESEPR